MRCQKCKTKVDKGTKFCPKCGAKVKHTGRRIVAAILVLAIIAGGAGFAGWKLGLLPFGNPGAAILTNGFALLTDSFTERKIINQESALAAIGDVAELLGMEDVNAELANCKEDTVFGNTYYRFYQEYEGIPVYGRSVVIAADAEGNCLSLSSNTSSISGLSTIKPSIDQASVKDSITKYISRNYGCSDTHISVEQIDSEALRIYCSNGKAKLAYLADVRFNSYDKIGYYEFVVDADDGKILYCAPMLYEAIGFMASDADKENGFEVFQSDDGYFLWNLDSNLYVLNLNGVPSQEKLTDSRGRILYDKNGKPYAITHWGEGEFVLSENEIFGDTDDEIQDNYETGARLLINVDSIASCFEELGFQNNTKIFLYYQDGFDGGDNALGGFIRDDIGVISMGTNTGVDSIDVIAHEFTHFVSRSIAHWSGNNETGSINEALSDIFGEIIEGYLANQEPNWQMSNFRNIAHPDGSCISDYSAYNESLDCHYASTLISHAAYLMYTGIGGSPAFESLSTSELAQLFYTTLYSLPSDCTFSAFRSLVQNTADIMCKQGWLTGRQRLCVSKAFFQVGIDSSQAVLYSVTPEFALSVYDVNGNLYDSYEATVTTIGTIQGPGLSAQKVSKQYSIEQAQPLYLKLTSGKTYQIVITDRESGDSYTYFVSTNIDGKRELPIYTTFNNAANDGFMTYLDAAKKTTSTGSWTEDMTMTANMVLTDGSSTTKTKATMEASVDIEGWNGTDTSSLYMSGAASMSVLNQAVTYTMTWQNGTAHYEYTKPTVSSADLKIDPSYFNFNSLTQDMISSSAVSGNQMTFTVRGDALTEIGLSAVNQLFAGVSNLEYGDAVVDVTIDPESGKIDTLGMTFHAAMSYQGYDAEVDYVIEYHISEKESLCESIFEALPQNFIFSRGAGAWETRFHLNLDGTFSGSYQDSEIGDTGDGYSNGTVYICNFEGKFSTPKQVNEYTYAMELEYLNVDGNPGEISYEEETRYIYADPYGFDDAGEFLIYLPGCPLDDVAKGFLLWLSVFTESDETVPAGYFGIYNVEAEEGFVGTAGDGF